MRSVIIFKDGSDRPNNSDVNKTKFLRPSKIKTNIRRPRPPEVNKGTWQI